MPILNPEVGTLDEEINLIWVSTSHSAASCSFLVYHVFDQNAAWVPGKVLFLLVRSPAHALDAADSHADPKSESLRRFRCLNVGKIPHLSSRAAGS